MASAPKRPKAAAGSSARGRGSADPLSGFLAWCGRAGVQLSPKVRLSREGAVAGYGLLAAAELEEGEVLFSVPRSAVLSQHTSSIQALLQEAQEALQSQSGWVPLLLALLYEYTASDSPWQPYFSLWQDFRSLDHPMFWPEEERTRLLQGTGIPEAVDKDLANIHLEYSSIILPFMKSHPSIFDPKLHTLDLYKQLVAFVMAYSFQEPLEEEDEDEKGPNPPMMVPVADILNHVANHNANLEYSPQCLRMVTTQPISKGQEIFNTYGQMANWQLLHMYGFAEPYPGNTNDTADIQMVTVREAALQREWHPQPPGHGRGRDLLNRPETGIRGDTRDMPVPQHFRRQRGSTAAAGLRAVGLLVPAGDGGGGGRLCAWLARGADRGRAVHDPEGAVHVRRRIQGV
ncbi:N-lysine methyltransferase SETD6 isoform X3 [Athene noctua]|uniref:N-lysine methyltransferase SETD6 isoform X3 n=1 Tax=Athene noctua TaxID=126797 RepID=UPI003EC105BF